jgi:hypothetical protein
LVGVGEGVAVATGVGVGVSVTVGVAVAVAAGVAVAVAVRVAVGVAVRVAVAVGVGVAVPAVSVGEGVVLGVGDGVGDGVDATAQISVSATLPSGLSKSAVSPLSFQTSAVVQRRSSASGAVAPGPLWMRTSTPGWSTNPGAWVEKSNSSFPATLRNFQPAMLCAAMGAVMPTTSSWRDGGEQISWVISSDGTWPLLVPPKSDAARNAATPEAANSAAGSQDRISLLLLLSRLLAAS